MHIGDATGGVLARRFAAALLAGVALAGGAAAARAAELVLATARTTLSLPIHVADAQGFFAGEGVAVRVAECIGGQRCLRQLFDGAAALATASDLPVMFNSFSRDDYAIVATFVTAANDLKLIARRSAGISAAALLEGKRVGTVKGSSAHYFLDAFLLFNNIDPQAVDIVALAPEAMAGALERREVDALAVWEPDGWLAVRAIGADAVVLPSPRIYTESFNLVAGRRVLAEREDEVVRVLRALARAQRFIAERPRDAQAVLMQRLGLNQAFVDWVWSDLDYRLGLNQSLITTLEAEARWALREGHVPAGQRLPNYLRYVEPGPLRRALPDNATILR